MSTAAAGSPAGVLPDHGQRRVDPNYTITYVPGTLTIEQAALTISANNQSMTYGGTLPGLTASTGLGQRRHGCGLTTLPTLVHGAGQQSRRYYPITASGAVDANYTITTSRHADHRAGGR